MKPLDRERKKIRADFLARISLDLEALQLARAATDLTTIGQLSHRLAGAAGMYGYPDVSRTASMVEEAIKQGDEDAALGRTSELIALLEEISPR